MNGADEHAEWQLGKDVDVLEMVPEHKAISFMVHVYCYEHELKSLPVQAIVAKKIDESLDYLIMEGYLQSRKGWNVSVCVMGHPPTQPPEINEDE